LELQYKGIKSHGGGHLGWRADFFDTNFKGDHLRTIVTKLVPIGPVVPEDDYVGWFK
jgi:hypothetical protein